MRKGYTTTSNEASPATGRDTISKPILKGKNGGKQSRKGADEAGGYGLHLLAKKLRSIPFYEHLQIQGKSGDSKKLHIIQTEEQRLQAIEDLYAVLIAQPVKVKEPNWTADNTSFDVLSWILRKLSPLAKGNNWTIDTYQDGDKKRYRFVVYSMYNSQQVTDRLEIVSLDFLPTLAIKDGPLHDMFVDLVALVTMNCKIPLWDEDGDYSKSLEILLNGDRNLEIIRQQRELYTTGLAGQYLRLIRERQFEVSDESIKNMIDRYERSKRDKDKYSQRMRNMIYCVRAGLTLQGNIKDFSYTPDYAGKNATSAHQFYKFIWSHDEDDVVNIYTASAKLYSPYTNPHYLPVQFSIAYPGQVLEPIKYNDYPVHLHRFMSNLVSHTRWSFKNYYYPRRGKNPIPLLETLELSEIKNEINAGL